ncbi:unnamed protein product [Owenia fusiformis]|uniref:Uncharacterized protein n=1 Tax=Owenia fusiformis TaxID=6347 RepID=A0A8J1THK7_OWEFU|nr:unnamed protein product [Owenia fusiformis]
MNFGENFDDNGESLKRERTRPKRGSRKPAKFDNFVLSVMERGRPSKRSYSESPRNRRPRPRSRSRSPRSPSKERCPICRMSFVNRSNCRRHLRRQHGVDPKRRSPSKESWDEIPFGERIPLHDTVSTVSMWDHKGSSKDNQGKKSKKDRHHHKSQSSTYAQKDRSFLPQSQKISKTPKGGTLSTSSNVLKTSEDPVPRASPTPSSKVITASNKSGTPSRVSTVTKTSKEPVTRASPMPNTQVVTTSNTSGTPRLSVSVCDIRDQPVSCDVTMPRSQVVTKTPKSGRSSATISASDQPVLRDSPASSKNSPRRSNIPGINPLEGQELDHPAPPILSLSPRITPRRRVITMRDQGTQTLGTSFGRNINIQHVENLYVGSANH